MSEKREPSASEMAQGCVVLTVIAAVAVFALTQCGGPEDPNDSEAPIEKVSAEELWATYANNEVAAEQRFQGKRVQVEGTVIRIVMRGGAPLVTLDTPHSSQTIDATVVAEDKKGAAKLRPATRAELLCSEVSKSVWVELNGCRILRADVPLPPEG